MKSDTSSDRSDDDDDSVDSGTDAISLLTSDHLEVAEMFAEYEALVSDDASGEERAAVVRRFCQALTAHAAVEEEIFYPAAREALGDDDMIDEAVAEHASVKELILQIQAMDPSDALYDATVRMLQESVDAHVDEEEGELFPRLQDSKLDLEELGERMAQRKEEALASLEAEES